MKSVISLSLLVLILFSCGENDYVVGTKLNPLENLSVEEAFHMESVGKCSANTRKHKAMSFTGLITEDVAGDRFVAQVLITLYRQTKTYDLSYSEYPFPSNIDQSIYSTSFTQTYDVVDNELILNNFGTIRATVENDKISPHIKITNVVRNVIETSTKIGRAVYYSDDDVVNECTP
ncbi:hypothetical protein [Halobacteriovorax sp. DPLXC-1]|uniref:hypothetical protein n=1 Tax=Halobacteriovorax sp. DPLXC-1 TaxID=3110771 RepID=UPI002FF3B8C5